MKISTKLTGSGLFHVQLKSKQPSFGGTMKMVVVNEFSLVQSEAISLASQLQKLLQKKSLQKEIDIKRRAKRNHEYRVYI